MTCAEAAACVGRLPVGVVSTRRRGCLRSLILCLYRAGIDEEGAQNLCWIFHKGISLVSVSLCLKMMHVFESLLAFVVRSHRLCHAIVYSANARFSTG